MIPAHDSPLAALAFDASGTKLATASEKVRLPGLRGTGLCTQPSDHTSFCVSSSQGAQATALWQGPLRALGVLLGARSSAGELGTCGTGDGCAPPSTHSPLRPDMAQDSGCGAEDLGGESESGDSVRGGSEHVPLHLTLSNEVGSRCVSLTRHPLCPAALLRL